ncbi:Zinc finger BED domain-containing protein RICESLEEPER 2 [Vitis vinifera]|uniref:Zinc finger BED domain-containing protein RICESLEEPER 2 n=1 Tax=Vitis vinifera TaxID=29760 RepID=A0A438BXS1_VITVI|nr:Zinc finger BED domain-containing protein RICESLEEPER 2 [Vitis vinifera]
MSSRKSIDGQDYAICKYCKSKLKADSKNGTKHLHVHLDRCIKRRNVDIKHQFLAIERKGYGKVQIGGFTFDQDISRKKLARAIILHEYPLSIVDHASFRDFASSLQPLFKMVSCNTIKDDIMKIYEFEKGKMSSYLEKLETRMTITTDMWTSNQKKGYMAITVHYIDESWLLHHHIVRFVYVPPPHTKEVLSDVLLDFLLDWNMDRKLSTITVDNCSSNDGMIDILSEKLSSSGSLLLNGKIFHMRCATHVLNLIVKEGLDVIRVEIEKIRESVAYWSATPSRVEKFEDSACQLRLPCNKKICFDWRNYPTANTFFIKVCEIKEALYDWLICSNEVVSTMASSMLEKFDKYWSGCHIVMAIAVVLDPRYKMKILEFYFPIMYGSEASSEIGKIRQLCYDLFSEYQSKSKMGQQTSSHGASLVPNLFELTYDEQDPLSKFDLFVHSTSEKGHAKSELDYYLEETVLPRISDFDVLSWWKTNVASESAFSTGGRMVSKHRSRLHPNILEALMCAQSWLGNEMEGANSQSWMKMMNHSCCSIKVVFFGKEGISADLIAINEDVGAACWGISVYISPMPLGIVVAGAKLLKNKGDGKQKREGLCVGTKGFRAPEPEALTLLKGLCALSALDGSIEDLEHILNEVKTHIFSSPPDPYPMRTMAGGSVANTIRELSAGFGCVCLVDALGNRTMRPCLSSVVKIQAEELTKEDFKGVKWLVMRYGIYNLEVIHAAIQMAKEEGVFVSLDLASFEMVRNFRGPLLELLQSGDIDLCFANEDETRELLRDDENASPEAALDFLAKHCQWAVVTLGSNRCLAKCGRERQIDVDMYITHLKLYAHLLHIAVGGCCTVDKGELQLLQSPPLWSPFEWPLEVKLLDCFISQRKITMEPMSHNFSNWEKPNTRTRTRARAPPRKHIWYGDGIIKSVLNGNGTH